MKIVLPVFTIGNRSGARFCITLVAAAVTLVVAAGCGKGGAKQKVAKTRGPVVIDSVKVVQRDWNLVASAVGSMAADEQVTIRNEVAGFIREIPVSEGILVKKGDLLLRIDDEKLTLEVKRAEAKYDEMRANVMRKKPLFEQKMIAEAEMIAAEASFKSAEAELELAKRKVVDSRVVAPMNGELGRRYVSVGDYVQAGSKLFDLVKMDVMKVEFNLPERYLPRLKVGQEVRMHTPAYPEKVFNGAVDFIDPLVDISTRTVRLRAKVPNPELLLRPNMFVNVDLDVGTVKNALVVPEQAVVTNLGGFSVFVVDAENKAEFHPVQIGEREPGWAQIIGDVKAGDRVVAAGHTTLYPGAAVVERSSLPPPSAGPAGGPPQHKPQDSHK